ncbi:FAD-dependent oxidoreductase [Oscillatoria sp. FACHB-1406]|uniref:FAD-dependent oxidoreductase n=1 Tax=Oscillatoria sp. FACHB-1406 TaxID=2692846 RepID=UPI00168761C2|nr:FAD-dependent oxidoreductase [Oscillatoria sp. FACHB-1406]MBD2577975.1 FAD-dependent oxidoreductase [Oscillatoria sp. FACHB-1406]
MSRIHPNRSPHLVLIGGGHSHAIALKLLATHPIPNLRLTLISDVTHTPYSGMLPGYIAGFYSYEETHIDLPPLAELAGAEFIHDRAVGLDLERKCVICDESSPIPFDYLSIDIGSTPARNTVPGAAEYTTPIKPVPEFLQVWQQIEATVTQHPDSPLTLAIVGGGAGGVELALNVQANLQRRYQAAGQPKENLTLHLFHRDERLLSGHNAWVSRRLEKILRDRGAIVHLGENVKEVLPDCLICESGLKVKCDRVGTSIFWVTQASAPPWIAASGLATDERGFILISETLQSVSHPFIFATGDIATMREHPRPKAGVFAVRQGKPLYKNVQRLAAGKSLLKYVPQRNYLALIGTGDKSAIASWGRLGWQSPLLWRWKDAIDRKFMQQFHEE